MNTIIPERTEQGYRLICEKKRFTILLISDLHLAERYVLKRPLLKRLRRIVDRVNPDLIINLGDFFCKRRFISPYHTVKLFNRIIGKDYLWTFVWGNHDYEAFLCKGSDPIGQIHRFEDFLQATPHCLYTTAKGIDQSEKAGQLIPGIKEPKELQNFMGGNFVLDIASNTNGDPKWKLFILNSRIASHIGNPVLSWIQHETGKDPASPGLCFFHIPIKAFADAWDSGSASGTRGEKISYKSHTEEIRHVFEQTKTIRACFAGHDHLNDFQGTYRGIQYIYARKTLRLGYGARDHKPCLLFTRNSETTIEWGAKLITLQMGHPEALNSTMDVTTLFE